MEEDSEAPLVGNSNQNTEKLHRQRQYSVEEENCVICLQKIIDRTTLPQCSHDLQCFACLIEWTKHSDKCPLCVSEIGPFVLHNLRGRHDFSRYFISPPLDPSIMRASRERRSSFTMAASRRQARREEARRQDELDAAISRRRNIYQKSLYAKHVASNRFTRYIAHPTPTQITASADLQSRATAFLRRELRVWANLDVEFLTNYIVTLIKTLDLRSEAAIRLLSDLLDPSITCTEAGRKPNTEHLVHELLSYLRSPYKNIEVYDRIVQYESAFQLSMRPIPDKTHYSRAKRPHSPSRSRSPSPHRNHKRSRSHLDYVDDSKAPRTSKDKYREILHSISSRVDVSNQAHQEQNEKVDTAHPRTKNSDYDTREGKSTADLEDNTHLHSSHNTGDDKELLLEHVRNEMIQKRLNESEGLAGPMELDPPTEPLLDDPLTSTEIDSSRRNELLSRLQEEKARIDASASQDSGDPSQNASQQGGFQIKGAAARAKERALQEMEQKLKAQALLRVKIAREKLQLPVQTERMTESGIASPSKMMKDMVLTSPVAEPGVQQKLREKLLRERLLMNRRMSMTLDSQPDV